jgi:hypothetical protein
VLFGVVNSPVARASDESAIRQMVTDAVRRLNQGDLTAIDEFWDEDADYVGIDGQFIHGRQAMRGCSPSYSRQEPEQKPLPLNKFVSSPPTWLSWTALGQFPAQKMRLERRSR